MPGTVIVGKSCLMDRRLFCCLGGGVFFFFNKGPGNVQEHILELINLSFRGRRKPMSLILLTDKEYQEQFYFQECLKQL